MRRQDSIREEGELDKFHESRRFEIDNLRSLERAIHDSNQITDASQIKVGNTYLRCNTSEKTQQLIRVVEEPKDGFFKARYEFPDGGTPFETNCSLADSGIMPYLPSGLWNTKNYLMPYEEEKQGTEE